MSILETAISWLAPPLCLGCGREGQALCEACAVTEILPHGERCWRCGALSPACRTCQRCRSFGGPRFVWCATDYAGLAAKALKAYKFGHQRFMAETLADLMSQVFLDFNPDELLAKQNYLVVPVPTATRRRRQRGFDHSALLARRLADKLKLPYCQALGRLGQTSKVGLRRAERLKLSAEDYFVRDQRSINRNILLIDDVLTTGATLRAATKTLRAAGAKHVDAVVFAKRL